MSESKTCAAPGGCCGPARAHGFCGKHLYRLGKYGSLDLPPKDPRGCEHEGCTEPHLAKGLCRRHYRQADYERNMEGYRAKRRARRAADPEPFREAQRRRYAASPEKFRQAMQDRRDADPEANRETERRYRIRNAAKVAERKRRYAEENADRLAAYWRDWALANPDKRRASNALRKARIRTTTVEPVDYEIIRAEFGDTCNICLGQIQPGDEIHFDHLIPLGGGHNGTHTADNIRPAHAQCNLRKGARFKS